MVIIYLKISAIIALLLTLTMVYLYGGYHRIATKVAMFLITYPFMIPLWPIFLYSTIGDQMDAMKAEGEK